jgi:two-component system chemotaxis response regulator CheY
MKILIAEDDPVSRRVLEATLIKWGYDVAVASDGVEAWEIINNENPPNLVISDWMMPRMDGLTLCRKIRSMEKSGYIYFIILTAKGEKEDVIHGLEAGADDFLTKPFNREELKYRTQIGERIIALERRILELANTDALTGVLNRRAFLERMEQETARSQRNKTSFSFIITDIDHFKKINDTHGHQAGDIVLEQFSKTLSKFMRPYDFIGRYGGEEFMICLSGVDETEAGSAAERMRKHTEEIEIMLPDGSHTIRITASFGKSSYKPESGESIDSVIKRADNALYQAKNEGRNLVR